MLNICLSNIFSGVTGFSAGKDIKGNLKVLQFKLYLANRQKGLHIIGTFKSSCSEAFYAF